jgi:hypothetical protein
MTGHGQKLTRRQEAVIAALLTQPTYEAAARAVGVGEKTVYRWLHLPAFARAYRQRRQEVLEKAVARLVGLLGKAAEALERNLMADKPGDQIRAALAVFGQAVKGIETLDLSERLAQIEESLGQGTPR